jgi:phosphoglucomutase
MEEFGKWLESERLSSKEHIELLELSSNTKEKEYRFGKTLEFGTAGMRGLIGMGTNMMNRHMVNWATQALANFIKATDNALSRGVVISYDTRRMSREFAVSCATVLATNGIKTYLYNEVHPVPMLSYAVRKLNAFAGIMITASHNPKEYNGYKVYGEDGAQMSPEATKNVVNFMSKIGSALSDEILFDEHSFKKVKKVPKFVDASYYRALKKLSLSKKEVKKVGKTIKLVYTPVHGSGYVPVTKILKKLGITATVILEQAKPDTEFSTVKVPNPEYAETLSIAIEKAKEIGADVVFGTDPDCDRLGVAIKDGEEFKSLSGNQVGVLLLDYILKRLKEKGKLNSSNFAVISFVTTSLAKSVANDYGIDLMETPVGFKYIGEKIKIYDDTGRRKFIFGFEESCGYLRGTHARDKDGVVASMLFAEMFCYYTYNGVSIKDRLEEIYKKYGYVVDKSVSVEYSGLNAMDEMNKVVNSMRKSTVKTIGREKVKATRDYLTLTKKITNGDLVKIDCDTANAVYYELEGGGFVCLRPSGTEPKLKIYYSVKGEDLNTAQKRFEKLKTAFANILEKKKEKAQ